MKHIMTTEELQALRGRSFDDGVSGWRIADLCRNDRLATRPPDTAQARRDARREGRRRSGEAT